MPAPGGKVKCTVRRVWLLIALVLAGLTGCAAAPPAPVPPNLHGQIAFISEQHTQVFGVSVDVAYGLYVLDLDTPDASRFVIAPADDYLASPTWSPAGDRLLLYRNTYDRDQGYIRRIILADAQPPHQQEPFIDAWIGLGPAWSPDGALVACVSGDAINVYDAVSRSLVEVLETPGTVSDLTWSPDSRSIAFEYTPVPTTTGGIAIMSVTGAGFTQLTFESGDRSPAWSADDRIAFVREGDIYVIDAAGGDVTRLTHDGYTTSPAWSPDAQKIAFVSSRDEKCGDGFADRAPFCTNALYVMNADGSDIQRLRQAREHIWTSVWGPPAPSPEL
jgi:Tol biopolymer transport system component